jgi:transcriptional regulator with XRE-family HTH domain
MHRACQRVLSKLLNVLICFFTPRRILGIATSRILLYDGLENFHLKVNEMHFLEKLDKLMNEKGITKHGLAKESGIPYTTILSFYDKGCDNIKLTTLRTLANYFGCTMDYLVDDSVDVMVEDVQDEQELIRLYEQAPERIRRAVDALLKGGE